MGAAETGHNGQGARERGWTIAHGAFARARRRADSALPGEEAAKRPEPATLPVRYAGVLAAMGFVLALTIGAAP